MKVKGFATALLALGATGITAGVVDAQPLSEPSAQVSVHGVDHGVGYTTATDGRGVITTVDAGVFALTSDAAAVTLTDAAGNVVATLPTSFVANGETFGLRPQISDTGRTMTMTPVSAPEISTHLAQLVNQHDETIARKQYNAGVGALIGAGIGAVIGFFLGGVGALVTIPIGAGIGALIGFSTP
ncbi:hypothetical protein ACGFNT_16490 [Nocardia iowensis]|uniref:hypothetical protein n=1 Tax=Nocardia iowensis TaxID=204891 RepID=UPI003718D213